MATRTPTIWSNNEAVFNGLAITKEFEPANEWDSDNGRPSDTQMTKDGMPVWSGEALIGQGWAGDVQPIQLRIVSKTKPTLKVDPAKIAALYTTAAAPASAPAPTKPLHAEMR